MQKDPVMPAFQSATQLAVFIYLNWCREGWEFEKYCLNQIHSFWWRGQTGLMTWGSRVNLTNRKIQHYTHFQENINIWLIAIEILSIQANKFMGTCWNWILYTLWQEPIELLAGVDLSKSDQDSPCLAKFCQIRPGQIGSNLGLTGLTRSGWVWSELIRFRVWFGLTSKSG